MSLEISTRFLFELGAVILAFILGFKLRSHMTQIAGNVGYRVGEHKGEHVALHFISSLLIVSGYKAVSKTVVPATYTEEEIKKNREILDKIDSACGLGKKLETLK